MKLVKLGGNIFAVVKIIRIKFFIKTVDLCEIEHKLWNGTESENTH